MKPITMRDLEGVVSRLNRMTKSPETAWTRTDGKLTANIGNYHLDGAYGGWKLARMCSDGGGITDVLHCGYTSKRDLYNQIHAYIKGMEDKGETK